jgi:hypothetical protein
MPAPIANIAGEDESESESRNESEREHAEMLQRSYEAMVAVQLWASPRPRPKPKHQPRSSMSMGMSESITTGGQSGGTEKQGGEASTMDAEHDAKSGEEDVNVEGTSEDEDGDGDEDERFWIGLDLLEEVGEEDEGK